MANLVFTDVGLDWIMDRAFNPDTVEPPMLAVAIGSGSTAPSAGDTALVSETFRVSGAAVTWTNTGTGAVLVEAEFAAGEGTGTVAEIGIFTDVDDNDPILIARALVGPFTKAAGATYSPQIPLTGADGNA